MKKLIIALISFVIFFPTTDFVIAHADETKSYYAKVLQEAKFYSQPNEEFGLFTIPSSYFVILYDNAGENFYKAKYQDLSGYVKKDEVTPMDGTPTSPFPNETFRVFNDNGLNFYEKTSYESTILGKLNFLDSYTLYGIQIGEEPFPNSSNAWYYSKITTNGQTSYGYAFSYYCDGFESFTENTEYFPEITNELVFSTSSINASGLSDSVKAIIILAVSLPCLIILYLLLSPSKKLKKPRGKIFARKSKDYYEFNEDDL